MTTSLHILEPLSAATREALEPLSLRATDFLVIGIEDESNFFMRPMVARFIDNAEQYPDTKVFTTRDKRLVVQGYGSSSFEARDFLKRIPESKLAKPDDFTAIDEWKVAATDVSAVMVNACWPRDRLLFLSEEAETLFEYLLKRFLSQTTRSEAAARFKLEGTVPEAPHDFRDHEDRPLSDYQRVAMQMGLGSEAIGLFMDKGTGKTATCIGRICLEARRTRAGRMGGGPRMMRVLIVAPNQVRLNWQREFDRFATAPGKVTLCRGSKFRRMKLMTHAIKSEDDCAFSAVIAGYDTVSADPKLFAAIPWDLVILDESQYIKSEKTDRWKSVKDIRENSARRMVLTGTPIGNTPFDLWTQLEFLGEGLSGFTTKKAFKTFHGKFVQTVADGAGNRTEKFVGVANVPLLKERLARLTFEITKEEAGLKLPPKVYDLHEVEMTGTQREYYAKLAKQLALELEEFLENSKMTKEMTAEHILTQLLRLSQITSGFCKWNPVVDPETGDVIRPGYVEQIPGGNPKVEAVLEMLQDPQNDPNEKTVIWCNFKEDMRVLMAALAAAGIGAVEYSGDVSQAKREEAEQRFNKDLSVKVLVANPQTAGEGLNLVGYDWDAKTPELPTYCGHEIYFSVNWSYLLRSQSEDRCHRRGTKMPVRITDLMVPFTIDQEMRERVTGKKEMALEITDIREILQGILNETDGE